LLIGDEPGIADASRSIGARHLPEVERNASGTPLIASMFEIARRESQSPLLCIINSDIILLPDFVLAAQQAASLVKEFVLLSRRWDLNSRQNLDFSVGWHDRLLQATRKDGQLHPPSGSDYFVFPRACYREVPAFAIGRAGWDNWMIYKARQQRWALIDATPSVVAIHQLHDYAHLPGGKSHHTLPETDDNIRMAGGQAAIRYTVLDATHELVSGKLVRPAWSTGRLVRQLELLLRRVFAAWPEDSLENVVRPKRWLKRLRRLFKW